MMPPTLAVVVKGYPRLSETFIAQEILALERRGFKILIVSLRHPTDLKIHKINQEIQAPILYLPEYLSDEPARVLKALLKNLMRLSTFKAFRALLADWWCDRTRNRIRRFGQALVLAGELPHSIRWIHTHYLHTPSAMTRYASMITGLPWSISAHAKDIWTTPDWQKRQHLLSAAWSVTCTRHNRDHLQSLVPDRPATLIYHGLDFSLLPKPGASAPPDDGTLRVVTVARAVEKKGLDTLLYALALLKVQGPVSWVQIGGGPKLEQLQTLAATLDLARHVAFRGALARSEVFDALAAADIFCLPARIAKDGDRDGLPNALMEAMYLGLPVVASRLPGIEELIDHGTDGFLVEPDDVEGFAAQVQALRVDPDLRRRIGANAKRKIHQQFGMDGGIDRLTARFAEHHIS